MEEFDVDRCECRNIYVDEKAVQVLVYAFEGEVVSTERTQRVRGTLEDVGLLSRGEMKQNEIEFGVLQVRHRGKTIGHLLG
jgi:hypothetical protein